MCFTCFTVSEKIVPLNANHSPIHPSIHMRTHGADAGCWKGGNLLGLHAKGGGGDPHDCIHFLLSFLGPGHFIYTVFSFETLGLHYEGVVEKPKRPVPRCFRFWYFMSGSGIGSLHVYVNSTAEYASQTGPAWSRHSNQGNEWLQAEVDIPPYVSTITDVSHCI